MKTQSDFTRAVNDVNDAIANIAEILRISGTPSLSYAVIHHGHVISTEHLGFRDVEAQAKPDNDTRHNINSLTKALVSSLVAMEVAKGNLTWSSKVKDLLPGFTSSDPFLQQECTIQDLVSHRTGLGAHDMGWCGPLNRLLLDRSDALPTFASLKPAGAFRDSFIYNNWCYELVGQILERATGKPLSQLLHDRIFKVLNMTRTSTEWNNPGGNNAKSYTVLDDLSAFEVPPPALEKGQIMEAAGGVKSSLSDLICLYQEMLKALAPNPHPDDGQSRKNVFEDCIHIFAPCNNLPGWSLREQSYGAGWCRAELPGQLGRISQNASLGPQPVVGKGRPSRLVIYHHGSMCGSQTVVNLLPETQSAVIALQNSLGPVDAADFAAELLVERLLGVQSPVDCIQLARNRTAQAFAYMDMLKLKLDSDRKLGTMPKPLEAYMGTYWNKIRNWRMDISRSSDDHLTVTFQGLQSEPFTLRHYNYDTFSWWMPYNDVMRSGQYAIGTTSSFWLMRFEANNFGEMVRLSWAMDTEFPEWEEIFIRD
ncbi:beta-lactamase/transpeptidase-like protein [Nemania sp. FL0031]|nr:beta-lactamase/transpeptidase-like protein [Nemania sp. FL0031]